jgi:hypothetical protein
MRRPRNGTRSTIKCYLTRHRLIGFVYCFDGSMLGKADENGGEGVVPGAGSRFLACLGKVMISIIQALACGTASERF